MQLSCKRGIGFICVPKCGSTTIESYMRNYCDFSLSGNPRLKHIKFIEYERHILPLLRALGVAPPNMFAVVRDPVDWLRSWYQFRKRDELANPGHPKHHNYSGNVSFDEYARLCMDAKPPSFARIQSQFSYVVNSNGVVGVDVVFPLDSVETAVPHFLDSFGITVKQPQKRRNVSEVRVYEQLQSQTLDDLHGHFRSDYKLYNTAKAEFALHASAVH